MVCKYVFLKPMQVLKLSNQFLFDSFVLKLQIFFYFIFYMQSKSATEEFICEGQNYSLMFIVKN